MRGAFCNTRQVRQRKTKSGLLDTLGNSFLVRDVKDRIPAHARYGHGNLGPVRNCELSHDLTNVNLDRRLWKIQRTPDSFVRFATAYALQNSALPVTQINLRCGWRERATLKCRKAAASAFVVLIFHKVGGGLSILT